MTAFLADGWLERCADLGADVAATPGLDLVVQHEIGEIPGVKGKRRWHVVLSDGRPVEVAEGKHADAAVTVALRYKDALPVVTGAQHPDVAYMQGRLKLDGAYEALLYGWNGRPVWHAPGVAAWLVAVAAATEVDPASS